MSKYVDITFKDKSWIFNGSVETHRCRPTETCGNCGGSGRCPSCRGQGETRCEKCGGRGIVRCQVCKGGGRCYHCGGSGVGSNGGNCPFCHGSGACDTCHGSGTLDCFYCDKTGFITCRDCSGSGSCNNCGGSGLVTCRRCRGTGFYQQYLEYTAHYCVRQLCYPGMKPELIQGLRLATGEELYKAISKLWKKEGDVAFDDTEKCLKQICASSGSYNSQAESFKKEYESTPEMQDAIPEYMPYKNTLISYKMPVTKITYEINGQEYVMYLLGDNGVVCYDDLPRTVKAFEMSNVERRKYNAYALERHQELAKLTAYIFNLDGINLEESKSLSLILRHMCMDEYERDRYIRYLTYRYTPEIPAEKMLKKTKHLMMSKKLISYVWQCIAVDHEISPKEQEFFDKLVACYNISESELSSLKRFSSKFATLADDQFVKEYLDSKPVYFGQKGFIPWLIGIVLGITLIIIDFAREDGNGFLILLGLAIGVTSFIFFRRNLPPEQKEIDKYYKELCKKPELDRMEANGSDSFLKIKARIGIFIDLLFGKK